MQHVNHRAVGSSGDDLIAFFPLADRLSKCFGCNLGNRGRPPCHNSKQRLDAGAWCAFCSSVLCTILSTCAAPEHLLLTVDADGCSELWLVLGPSWSCMGPKRACCGLIGCLGHWPSGSGDMPWWIRVCTAVLYRGVLLPTAADGCHKMHDLMLVGPSSG